MPGVSDVGVEMSWMWERILLSEIFLLSRSSGSRVVSKTVHLIFPSTEAEAALGEVDESSCLTCGTLLLSTVRGILRETLSVVVVRERVLCLLLLRDRLCEVDRGLGMKMRDG